MVLIGNVIYESKWDWLDTNKFVNANNFRTFGNIPRNAVFAGCGFRNLNEPSKLTFGIFFTLNGENYIYDYKVVRTIESSVLYEGFRVIKLDVYVDPTHPQ